MTIAELLDELRRFSVRLTARDDKLVVDAPPGVITPSLADAIRTNKAALLALFSRTPTGSTEEIFALPHAPNEDRLSLTQERIWAIDQLTPESGQFNLPGSWWLNGPLDADRFEGAVARLVDGHDLFKRRFITREGKAVVSAPDFPGYEFRHLTTNDLGIEAATQSHLSAWLAQISKEPFDLEHDPLLRVTLVRVEEQRHLLVVVSHSAVWDAWCYDIFLNELGRLYQGDVKGTDLPTHQYADYVYWQRERQNDDSVIESLRAEAARLEGAHHRLKLPLDYPDPEPGDHSGARFNFLLPADLHQRIKAFARNMGATPFMVMLTSYITLLCKYADHDSVLVTIPLRGREKRQFEGIFGPFTNNLFLKASIRDQSFTSLLNQVKARVGEAFGSEIAPFERLVEILNQDLAASAFFQLQFSFQNVEDRRTHWATGIELSMGPQQDFHSTHADLSFWVREGTNMVDGAIDYRTTMFNEATIALFQERLLQLTEEGIRSPDHPLMAMLTGEHDIAVTVTRPGDSSSAAEKIKHALEGRLDDVVVQLSTGESLLAADLITLLTSANDNSGSGQLTAVASAIAALQGESCGKDILNDWTPLQIDQAINAWSARLQCNDNRILIVDATVTPSSLVSWLAVLAAGKTLCVPTRAQANDEVSIHRLMTTLNVDLVSLGSPLMLALLELAPVSPAPRFFASALPGGSHLVDLASESGLDITMVLACDATLGIGLLGAAGGWPHRMDVVEAGITASVLDRAGRPQLKGIDGELALAPGSDRPERLPHHYSVRQKEASTFYWLDTEGEDEQLLDDLRTRILSLPQIVDAHVSWRDAGPLGKSPIVWIVQQHRAEMTSTEIRSRLQQPKARAPLIIDVDVIRRGRSGHVLVKELPHPDTSPTYAGYEPPSTEREIAFAEIWGEILEIDRIGVNDSFANLGGNSVQALIVLSETQKRLGWSFEPRLLFFQTLRQIANREPSANGTGQVA